MASPTNRTTIAPTPAIKTTNPSRLPQDALGTQAVVTGAAIGRVVPKAVLLMKGPASPSEEFVTDDPKNLARALSQLQQNIRTAQNPIVSLPFSQGNLFENVAVLSGQNVIQHQLGGPFRGYILCKQLPASVPITMVLFDQASAALDARQITFTCSGSATVDVWVYR